MGNRAGSTPVARTNTQVDSEGSYSKFMKTTFLLIRHGESQANSEHYFAGGIDALPTDKGKKQSKLTAKYLVENYRIDVVYSSDLNRALEISNAIKELSAKPVIKDERLREIYAGEWQGKTFDALEKEYKKNYGEWLRDIGNAVCDGGESVENLYDRVWSFMDEVLSLEQGKTIAIVTHATPIRALLTKMKGLSLEQMKTVAWVSNSSITEVVNVDGQWKINCESLDEYLNEMRTVFPSNV